MPSKKPPLSPTVTKLRRLYSKPQHGVRWLHAVGSLVQECFPKGKNRAYGENVMAKLAKKTAPGESPTTVANLLWTARKFAEEFSPKEAAQLAQPSAEGKTLKISHITYALKVPRDERIALLETCRKDGWSVKELALRIRQSHDKESGGGRKPPRPRSLPEALVQITQRAEQWLEWYQVLSKKPSKQAKADFKRGDLPRRVKELLTVATNALTQVRDAAGNKSSALREADPPTKTPDSAGKKSSVRRKAAAKGKGRKRKGRKR